MNHSKEENFDWNKWIEKPVNVKDASSGILKYYGATKFSDGLWCGIELKEPVGKNNGTVNNVKYFTCQPKYGIFVPVSRVTKIETKTKNMNKTYGLLNGTFEVQSCREKTVILSNSDDYSYNKENEQLGVKNNKTLNIRQDSEESLGLLDLNLIDAMANSWDSLNLDTAADVPNYNDSIFELDDQDIDYAAPYLPFSSNLSTYELNNPKYASTPRHPVTKRFTNFSDINDMGMVLQNINEHSEVLENQINSTQDVFFDTEKLKSNPNLTSTCEFRRNVGCSDSNVSCFSPIKSNPLQSIDLNKTQTIPLTNQGIKQVSVDLNETKTLQNMSNVVASNNDSLSTTIIIPMETKPPEIVDLNSAVSLNVAQKFYPVRTLLDDISEVNETFTKDLNATVSLKTKEAIEIYQKSGQVETIAESLPETDCSLSKSLNLTVSLENYQNSCQIEMPSDNCLETNSTETKDLNSTINLQILETTETNKKSYIVSTLADMASHVNINLNATYDHGVKFHDDPIESPVNLISESETINSNPSNPLNSAEDGNQSLMQKTFVLDSSLHKESMSEAVLSDNYIQPECFNYKDKFLEETFVLEKSLSSTNSQNSIPEPVGSIKTLKCPRNFSNHFGLKSTFHRNDKVLDNVLVNSTNLKKSPCIQNITSNADRKKIEFKKPFPLRSSLRKPKTSSSISCIISKETISFSKKNILTGSEKSFLSKMDPLGSESCIDRKLEQEEKEQKNFNCIENKSVLPRKSLVSCKSYKSSIKSVDVKPKKGRLSASFDLEDKFNRQAKAAEKSKYSRRFSYSQNSETTGLSNTTGSLLVQIKPNESFKMPNTSKLFASPKALSTNDSNNHDASKVSVSDSKVTVLMENKINKPSGNVKIPLVSGLKEPTTKNRVSFSRQSLQFSSNECGIPRRNSLVANSKIKLPVGIVKPRYSLLPSTEERKIGKTKIAAKKPAYSLVPEALPKVSNNVKAHSGKINKSVSPLTQESQTAARKMGQKYSDRNKTSDAGLKVPRYNLRGKK